MSDIQPTRLKFNPDYAVPPGETLKEVLQDRGYSIYGFATEIGVGEEMLSAVIAGAARMPPSMSLECERVLGTPAVFWHKREKMYWEGIKRND